MLDPYPVDVGSIATNHTTAMKIHQILIAAALPFAFAACSEAEKKKEEVKATAAEAVDKAKEAAAAEVDKAKDAAAAEVDKVKDAAGEAVDKAKDAAAEGLQDAADKLKTE